MARILEPEAFLKEALTFPVVDVRSPGEFLQGHIPGAVNIPLFDDSERAVIGTLYNHSGSDTAIRKGIEIATPKISLYLGFIKCRYQRSPDPCTLLARRNAKRAYGGTVRTRGI